MFRIKKTKNHYQAYEKFSQQNYNSKYINKKNEYEIKLNGLDQININYN